MLILLIIILLLCLVFPGLKTLLVKCWWLVIVLGIGTIIWDAANKGVYHCITLLLSALCLAPIFWILVKLIKWANKMQNAPNR